MMLDELKAKSLLGDFDIPVNDGREVLDVDDAVKAAGSIGFPVAMKVLSQKISHKSDLGLVRLDISSSEGVRDAYEHILSKAKSIDPGARVVVETMAPDGTEVIVGAKRDPQFGPVILFGLGGIFVEVFKDVSLRVAPVNKKMAMNMIGGIKGYVILKGYRGKNGVDIDALADIIVKVSDLMMSRKDVQELDANPVIAYEKGAVAVDARVLLKD
ncbi:acetyl-CoA synthetase [Methanocella sp. CWC-04]|uniref:acetate--CoA ligase (ADP-forming) n=1 Tax=Methanooceanicella nereidis TaxID=2052831 RepID=A0AAP2W4F7_9EURY|nr:acetate--CoA ligase family protein [Methanocella sp. CWC-04]MCD1294225.1 acetyl-CoA synthetase [Methanocella sp. CWC-04]